MICERIVLRRRGLFGPFRIERQMAVGEDRYRVGFIKILVRVPSAELIPFLYGSIYLDGPPLDADEVLYGGQIKNYAEATGRF